MAANQEIQLPLAEGEIVRDSPLQTLGLCLLAIFVFAPLGVGMMWAWWTEFSFLDRQIAWYGAFLGAVFLLGGIIAVPLAFLCFFRRNQLIFGKDCLQLVRHEIVTIQIPYKNIARLGMDESEVTGQYVGIDLSNPSEAGTLCPGAAVTKNGFGWHYTLSDESWTMSLSQIHDQIKKRVPSNQSGK